MKKKLTIVLVHGAWADGSQWGKIIRILQGAGLTCRAVQLCLSSLDDDVTTTTNIIEAVEGPVLLVGHSYGGVVITSAAKHEQVVGMVYLAAFAPDAGESLGSLLARRQSYGARNILPDKNGFLWFNEEKFHKSLCHDLDLEIAHVLAACQRPLHSGCASAVTDTPSWKNKRCWYQISNDDRILPAETQQEMAERMSPEKILNLDASHLSMLSKPQETSSLILEAASFLSS